MQIRLTLDPKTGEGRLYRAADGSLLVDNGLKTVLEICWFTDAPAGPDSDLPIDEQRGYWDDALDEDDTRAIGSTLWLITRRPLTDETLRAVESELKRASWPLTESGAASDVIVTCTRDLERENSAKIHAQILGPDGETIFSDEWEQLFAL